MEKKISKEEKFYRTSDFALATAISLFYPIEAIEKENPKRAIFVFKRTKELEKTIAKYWKRELKVEPQAYFNQMRILKARLYNEE